MEVGRLPLSPARDVSLQLVTHTQAGRAKGTLVLTRLSGVPVCRTAMAVAALAAAGLAMAAGTAPAASAAGKPDAARPATVSRVARESTSAETSSGSAVRPPGRDWASLAYYPPRHELVLFGGDQAGTVFGGTWTRTGTIWTKRHPARSPSARTGAAVAWDPATGQLLLFGGSTRPGTDGGFLGDTWSWNGTTWRLLHPAVSPPARHNADMIYDAASGNVILFGCYDCAYLGDTWAWNGAIWTQLHPVASPAPRDSESLAYDAATRKAILFGGYNSSAGRLSGTWAWNGTTWTQLHPVTSPGVVTTAWQAAYDPASKQLLLFGGDPGDGSPQDGTWAWTGRNWRMLHPQSSPLGHAYGSMTYDGATRKIDLVGGNVNGSATLYPRFTWSWNGRTWRIG